MAQYGASIERKINEFHVFSFKNCIFDVHNVTTLWLSNHSGQMT